MCLFGSNILPECFYDHAYVPAALAILFLTQCNMGAGIFPVLAELSACLAPGGCMYPLGGLRFAVEPDHENEQGFCAEPEQHSDSSEFHRREWSIQY